MPHTRQGVDLGNFLIKEVAKALKTEHMQLETFATLSPIPQFVPWLETQRSRANDSLRVRPEHLSALRAALAAEAPGKDELSSLSSVALVLHALTIENWHENAALARALEPILLKLGAQYIYEEKKRGKALCPVSNFHIRNGAIFERINWLADPSPKVRVSVTSARWTRQELLTRGPDDAYVLVGTAPERRHDGQLQVRPHARRGEQRELLAPERHPHWRAAAAHPRALAASTCHPVRDQWSRVPSRRLSDSVEEL